MQRQML